MTNHKETYIISLITQELRMYKECDEQSLVI